jgi:glutamine kinase
MGLLELKKLQMIYFLTLNPKIIKRVVNMKLLSKSKTLKSLEKHLKKAKILPQFNLTFNEWNIAKKNINNIWLKRPAWSHQKLIVRSSSLNEDNHNQSNAGKFLSIKDVENDKDLNASIEKVFLSFEDLHKNDEIFIQPNLGNIKISGVAFTKDHNNGSYYNVINYDDLSGKSDTVTSGLGQSLKIFYHFKYSPAPEIKWKKDLIELIKELEEIFKTDELDIEFAFDKSMKLYLFQVRKLIINNIGINKEEHKVILSNLKNRIKEFSKPHPYLLGKNAVFGVMPDWNPAEVIGARPRPLALSLYKELITDGVWAYQRSNYGYRNLRSFPLLLSFLGLPYIDVRVSFNSFIPSKLGSQLADKLVNYYIEKLKKNKKMHDKVEFDVVFSCYTFDLPKRINELKDFNFSDLECNEIITKLRELTNNIMDSQNGLWKQDIKRLEELSKRQKLIFNSDLNSLDKIYWLLEDCKRYGTLPFAGLARAGFIAVQFLQSMVSLGILTTADHDNFMGSLKTISSSLNEDSKLSKKNFLKKYGHLRPGTYDIRLPRYDEKPELYLTNKDGEEIELSSKEKNNFTLSLETIKKVEELIKHHKLNQNILTIFEFIKGAIEGREYGKFVFTKSLSDILYLITDLGKGFKLDKEQLSYSDINSIKQAYSTSNDVRKTLLDSIIIGKENYLKTCSITLPSLIETINDVYSFDIISEEPNYITQRSIQAKVIFEYDLKEFFTGNILLIESADPGYDWIFLHGIKGFVTKYGGTNSHMAIRAAELGIPAIIGSGEILFKKLSKAKIINIDCANKKVSIIK